MIQVYFSKKVVLTFQRNVCMVRPLRVQKYAGTFLEVKRLRISRGAIWKSGSGLSFLGSCVGIKSGFLVTLWKIIVKGMEMFPFRNETLESLRTNRIKVGKFVQRINLARNLLSPLLTICVLRATLLDAVGWIPACTGGVLDTRNRHPLNSVLGR